MIEVLRRTEFKAISIIENFYIKDIPVGNLLLALGVRLNSFVNFYSNRKVKYNETIENFNKKF